MQAIRMKIHFYTDTFHFDASSISFFFPNYWKDLKFYSFNFLNEKIGLFLQNYERKIH